MTGWHARKVGADSWVVIHGNVQYAVDTVSRKCSCGGGPLCKHYQLVQRIVDAQSYARQQRVIMGR